MLIKRTERQARRGTLAAGERLVGPGVVPVAVATAVAQADLVKVSVDDLQGGGAFEVVDHVGVANDPRQPYSTGPVPQEFGIHGTHGITVSVLDLGLSADFMSEGWGGRLTLEEGDRARFEVGAGGPGAIVDFLAEPGRPQAGWMYGEGIVHHTAFQVEDFNTQDEVKHSLVGMGFTDVSDRKDRGYFDSVYVRTPGGAMFEATVSKPTGFLIDESFDELGMSLQVPPVFSDKRDFLIGYLEPLQFSR